MVNYTTLRDVCAPVAVTALRGLLTHFTEEEIREYHYHQTPRTWTQEVWKDRYGFYRRVADCCDYDELAEIEACLGILWGGDFFDLIDSFGGLSTPWDSGTTARQRLRQHRWHPKGWKHSAERLRRDRRRSGKPWLPPLNV